MKLIYRLAFRLLGVLLPLIAIWATLFYFTILDEINDEADDALEAYSELIIMKMLAGLELPSLNSGSNNSYSITPIPPEQAHQFTSIQYYDEWVYIPEKQETEPARVLKTVFQDSQDHYYLLTVATPTFEKDDLRDAILYWVIFLYFLLLVIIIGVVVFVFYRNMRPLYVLLDWLDRYTPGKNKTPIKSDTSISEFRKLNLAVQRAVERSEELFEQQKQFIGNASHELQTPLAILSNRIEWLLDNTNTTETQIGELLKMQRTLSHIVKLNKTLLLLTKIDNGQFPDSTEVDIAMLVRDQVAACDEIYASRQIVCTLHNSGKFLLHMNESLALVLIANLVKNAYLYTPKGGCIEIRINWDKLEILNDGESALDATHLFDRFYQGTKKEGSTGLGLALVSAVCQYYHLNINYFFEQKRHHFSFTSKSGITFVP